MTNNLIIKLKDHCSVSLFKNAYFMMSSSIINSACGFVFWMIASRAYSVADIGIAVAIISSLGIIASISELGLGIGLIRFLPDSGKDGTDLINTVLTTSGLASIIIALIFLSNIGFWTPDLKPFIAKIRYVIFFIFFAIIWTLNQFMGSIFMSKRASKFIFIQDTLVGIIKLIIVIPCVFFIGGALGIVSSLAISLLIPFCVAIFLLIPKIQDKYLLFPTLHFNLIGSMKTYVTGNYIARIFLDANIMLIPLLVLNVLGAESNAFFYMSWVIAIMLRIIPNAVANSLFAEASNNEEDLHKNIRRALKIICALLIPAIAIIAILADYLLLCFGKVYSHNGVFLLRVLCLANIPWSIIYLNISIGRARNDIESIIKTSSALLFFTIGISYFLMKQHGLSGLGIGYLMGHSIVAITIALSYLNRRKRSYLKTA